MPWSDWAREPQLLSLRIWSLCSATREATIVRGPCTAMKSGPHLPQLEKALAQKRRPNIAIKLKINKNFKKKDLKGEIQSNTIIVRDFNTHLHQWIDHLERKPIRRYWP